MPIRAAADIVAFVAGFVRLQTASNTRRGSHAEVPNRAASAAMEQVLGTPALPSRLACELLRVACGLRQGAV